MGDRQGLSISRKQERSASKKLTEQGQRAGQDHLDQAGQWRLTSSDSTGSTGGKLREGKGFVQGHTAAGDESRPVGSGGRGVWVLCPSFVKKRCDHLSGEFNNE